MQLFSVQSFYIIPFGEEGEFKHATNEQGNLFQTN